MEKYATKICFFWVDLYPKYYVINLSKLCSGSLCDERIFCKGVQRMEGNPLTVWLQCHFFYLLLQYLSSPNTQKFTGPWIIQPTGEKLCIIVNIGASHIGHWDDGKVKSCKDGFCSDAPWLSDRKYNGNTSSSIYSGVFYFMSLSQGECVRLILDLSLGLAIKLILVVITRTERILAPHLNYSTFKLTCVLWLFCIDSLGQFGRNCRQINKTKKTKEIWL